MGRDGYNGPSMSRVAVLMTPSAPLASTMSCPRSSLYLAAHDHERSTFAAGAALICFGRDDGRDGYN